MTSLQVTGGRQLRGAVTVPGDKSMSHRALLLAAPAEGLTGGRSRLHAPADVLDLGNRQAGLRRLAGLFAGFPWLTRPDRRQLRPPAPRRRLRRPRRGTGA